MTIHIRQPLPRPGIETLIDDALFAAPTGASYDRLAKRILDITIVLLGALPVLIVTMVLAAIIALDGKSPFYLQKRVGRNGRVFYMYKLRSMVVDADSRLEAYLASNPEARAEWNHAQKLRRDPRITAVGRLIRKTSLDELPQLLNVLRGDMSLVGPRPIVADEIQRYGRYFSHYCRVRPGITGLWQVSGRSDVSYRRRVAFDVVYTRSYSVALNTKILLYTIPCVLRQRGSY